MWLTEDRYVSEEYAEMMVKLLWNVSGSAPTEELRLTSLNNWFEHSMTWKQWEIAERFRQ